MTALTQQQLKTMFDTNVEPGKIWRKHGTFLIRPATPGELILTITSGRLETIREAEAGDVVVINITIGSSAERYILSEAMLNKRYKLLDKTALLDGFEWRMAAARGEVRGFFYKGPQITIIAPWKEEMLVSNDDFIANPVDGAESDIYRIERAAFDLTYRLAA